MQARYRWLLSLAGLLMAVLPARAQVLYSVNYASPFGLSPYAVTPLGLTTYGAGGTGVTYSTVNLAPATFSTYSVRPQSFNNVYFGRYRNQLPITNTVIVPNANSGGGGGGGGGGTNLDKKLDEVVSEIKKVGSAVAEVKEKLNKLTPGQPVTPRPTGTTLPLGGAATPPAGGTVVPEALTVAPTPAAAPPAEQTLARMQALAAQLERQKNQVESTKTIVQDFEAAGAASTPQCKKYKDQLKTSEDAVKKTQEELDKLLKPASPQ